MRKTLTLLSLAFLTLPVSAGQFDHVYAGKKSTTSRDPLELNWESRLLKRLVKMESLFLARTKSL